MTYAILILAIGINFLLAMAELAVVSSRPVRLEQRANKGDKGAKVALELARSPTRFLSVAQAGITLVAIFAGAFGEKAIATDLEHWLTNNHLLGDNHRVIDTFSFAVVTLAIGYVTLVFGELVPKRLGMTSPEPIACFVARPMRWLSIAMSPVVTLLAFSTELILKLLRLNTLKTDAITTEEIKSLMKMGTEEGVFHEREQEMVDRVFRLADQSVSALMVPRTEIAWLKVDAPREKAAEIIRSSGRSHYPVYQGDLEHPVGVVHVKDVARALLSGPFDMKQVMRPPLFVPESMPALRVLDEFKRVGTHIAFILDEYGGLAGLITLNDIVAGVLGQIKRTGDNREDPAEITRHDGTLLLDGLLPLARVREITGEERLPKEEAGFNTLAGLLITNLGRIPRAGDAFQWGAHRFEVMDMDKRRVDKVLYTRTPERREDAPEHAE